MSHRLATAYCVSLLSVVTSLNASIFFDDFDSDTVGGAPAAWSRNSSTLIYVADSYSVSNSNSLFMRQGDSARKLTLTNYVTIPDATQDLVFSFDYFVPATLEGGGSHPDFLIFEIDFGSGFQPILYDAGRPDGFAQTMDYAGAQLTLANADGSQADFMNYSVIVPSSYYSDTLTATEFKLRFSWKSTSPNEDAYIDNVSVAELPGFSHQELVVNANGGFENGHAGWYQGHTGLSSNAFEGVNASSHSHGTYWKHSWYEFDCDPAKEYAVSFAAASDHTTSNGVFQIRYYDSSHSEIATDHLLSLLGTNAYSVYRADGIYPPAGVQYARFYFAAGYPGTGTTYLDDVLITTDADESGLASSSFIAQDITSITPDPGLESGVSDWNGSVSLETTVVAEGSQAVRLNGASYWKTFSHDLIPVTAGQYYKLSFQAAVLNVSVSPSLYFRFYAADGTTRLGGSSTLVDFAGTAPFREFSSPYVLAPAGAAYIQIISNFPKSNSGAKLYLDEVHLYEAKNLPVRLVPTYESIGVYVSRETQVANEVAHIYYRETGSTQWYEAYQSEFDDTRGEYRGSIVGLLEDTEYEVQVVLEVDGIKFDEAGEKVTTWDSTPTIAQTISVSSLYTSGQLLIENMHGEPDGWIKITGTGADDIDGAYADDVALKIINSSYLIFENIEIVGGRRHAVQVEMSDQIRIVDCEMSGWARQPNYSDGVYSYETLSDKNKGKGSAINKDAGVHLAGSSRVTVERCYIHDPRLSANNWGENANKHPMGPTAIYVQNQIVSSTKNMKGNFVVRYNDLIGSDDIRWNDVIEGENNTSPIGSFYRDSDVYGNMLAFANDDGTELDGGQMNMRFFGNRIESCRVSLSLAPCIVGPSYVFNNLMFNQGDDNDESVTIVKLGGGTTYSKGKSFFFNNTIYGKGKGLAGVGIGSDTNREMFLGQTRNNIIHTTNSHADYNKTIRDAEQHPWNSFDYDNLSTKNWAAASVQYAAGQEANGVLDDEPIFVNAGVGDFRLASNSSGIDDGLGLFNFADQYLGNAPDQGAIEHGDSSLFPIRPIAISADKYFVELSGTVGGSSTPVNVVLTTAALADSLAYEVRMNNTVDWLSVAPATGTLSPNSTQMLTLTLQTASLSSGDRLEATILVRFDDGFSIPITVNAEAL
ncbi:hypothetical protein QEH52_02505 [Coraliomargarita sp. SDUM461003]|uniref:MSP domain-containing protein n=1 Tax=Thalassobacterium maritimum TaxID=3041265 RepID=A0ABU1AQB5_9BACT|nr:hypothetical protein [Coraliomargarita sp. SDUM461003]MDQ8206363.1 hypothetical protein [Coraliomargarita sp. SDUM461003]